MYLRICYINHLFVKFALPLGLLTKTFHMYKSHLRTISRKEFECAIYINEEYRACKLAHNM